MTGLERRYRLLLRVLPRWYRSEREEEMVATFLTDRAASAGGNLGLENAWPGWGEVWAVLTLAARTRLAAKGVRRAAAIGDAVRLTALLGLLVQSAVVVGSDTSLLVALAVLPRSYSLEVLDLTATSWVASVVAMAVVPAFAALATGRRTAARRLALVALLPGLYQAGASLVRGEPVVESLAIVAGQTALWLAVACLYIGFHRDAPPPRDRPWLRAFIPVAGAAVLHGVLIALYLAALLERPWAVEFVPSWALPLMTGYSLPAGWAVVVAGLVVLATRRRGTAWGVALAVTTLPVVVQQAWTFAVYAGKQPYPITTAYAASAATLLAAALAVGAACAVTAARGLSRLDAPLRPAT
jgi:hypothetical protein